MHETMQRLFSRTGLSPTDLANAMNESPQNINNWSKRGISKSGATKAFEVFGIPIEWILTGKGEVQNTAIAKIKGLDIAPPHNLVPILNMVQAGVFTEVGDNDYSEWEYTHHKDGGYWLRIEGDSMLPEFQPNDLILVSSQRQATTGNYVVAVVKGENKATFKKFRERFDEKTGQQYVQLVALNDFYAPIDSRYKSFSICGVVLEHKRSLA